MRRLLPYLLLGLLVSAGPVAAVPFVVTVPASTPAGGPVWIAGDRSELGAWSGAGVRLERRADGAWVGAAAIPAGTPFEFKVTRGSWDTVEKDAGGGEVGNRRATAGDDTVRAVVAAWRDQTEGPAVVTHTITGLVKSHPAFPSRFVKARDVLVWLPPGYDVQTERRYPVVYFHDGQNVFDGATSFIRGREWGADEAADRLIRSRALEPFLMVAVANTSDRVDEYTSEPGGPRGGGRSAEYFRFLLEELMPFVDAHYRTRRDPAHTAVIGSSLGGLASLDLGLAHPERFGLVGCVSPAVWWADTAIVHRVRTGAKAPLRVWVDIGTEESTGDSTGRKVWLEHARFLRDALVAKGWREDDDLHYEEVAGARHDEPAWAARIDRILLWLFTKR